MTVFVGAAGYQAMLSRALVLAKVAEPALREVTLSMNGTLNLATQSDSQQTAAGAIVLLAQLLALVETLVGEALMLRLVQGVWPMVTLDLSLNAQEVNGEVIP